jgi:transcriptional regulator with XRE-family HTH domain
MTINEKIHMIRIKKGMSLAELAFKTGFSIQEIKKVETIGTIIYAYSLLKIIEAFDMSLEEFQNL